MVEHKIALAACGVVFVIDCIVRLYRVAVCSCCKSMVLVTLGGCHLLVDLVACDSIKAHKENCAMLPN